MVQALDKEVGFTLPDGSVLGRRGKPEEVAKLIQFLLSSDSSYTTGSIYSIDGGALCWFWVHDSFVTFCGYLILWGYQSGMDNAGVKSDHAGILTRKWLILLEGGTRSLDS
jgi:hypothetical protein